MNGKRPEVGRPQGQFGAILPSSRDLSPGPGGAAAAQRHHFDPLPLRPPVSFPNSAAAASLDPLPNGPLACTSPSKSLRAIN